MRLVAFALVSMARTKNSRRHVARPQIGFQRSESTATSPWRLLLPYFLLAGVCAAVFARGVTNEFLIWDDRLNVVDNPLLHPVSAGNLATIWSQPYKGLYAPVSYSFFAAETWLSERFGFSVSGDEAQAVVFHAASLLLHVLACWLVYALLAQLTGHRGAATLAALVFAVHPLQVESVAWVTETRGLLAAVAGLFALWQYVRFVDADEVRTIQPPVGKPDARTQRHQQRPATASQPPRHLGRYALATAAMVLAVLAKPSAVVLPLLAGVLQMTVLRQNWRRSVPWLAGWVALGVLMLVITWSQQQEKIVDTAPLYLRPLLALDALAFYGFKTLVPWPLGADYGWRPSVLAGTWWFYAIWIIPVALAAWLVARRRRDTWTAGALLFVAALVPVLGLVPFGFQYVSSVADRYAYLAMFGVAWIIAELLARHWRPVTIGTAIAVIALLAGLSFTQVDVWRNDETLFTHALKVNDNSFAAMTNLGRWQAMHGQLDKAILYYHQSLAIFELSPVTHYCLGHALMSQRQYAEAVPHLARAAELNALDADPRVLCGEALLVLGKPQEARSQFDEALRIAPTSAMAATGLGKVLAQAADYAGAEAQFRQVIALDDQFPQQVGADAHFALAYLLANRGRWDEAADEFAVVVRRRPQDLTARQKLAEVRLQQGRADEAAATLTEVLHNNPDFIDAYHGLAQALLASGRTEEALAQYRAALARQPQWIVGQLNLAWLLATLPDQRLRDPNQAIALAERACEVTKRQAPFPLDVLAAARAAAGDFPGAIAAADEALRLAGQQPDSKATDIAARRDLYRAGKAYLAPPRTPSR
ncbi:MAG: tetratricopeptide repeat protein [Pirellulales bacterium]|nr:tetratricopeptide repeat protein [Pirellulales bacterium]